VIPLPSLRAEPHPLLDARAFLSELPAPLGQLTVPETILQLLRSNAEAPISADDAVRGAVRDLLRQGGYKPTGRGKPASEYLIRAVAEGALASINLAVDVCNAVSFHSGLPISVVDLERTRGSSFTVRLGRTDEKYVFNASGQELDAEGLLCLCDEEGPCANAVKDAQRTKTHGETRRTLSIVWGSKSLTERVDRTVSWYRLLLESANVRTTPLSVEPSPAG
jgi:DNA/RNA-binding domain of Phe-tRNA-synthetase-like protein